MADGNCWMTENLRLVFAGTTATGLTANDSDIANTYTSSNPLVIEATQPYNQPETGTRQDGTAYTNFDWKENDAGTSNPINLWRSRNSNRYETDTSEGNVTGENQYLGVYYNWIVATAGTGTFETPLNTTVSSSICPKNWMLPKSANDKSFRYLLVNNYHILTSTENSARYISQERYEEISQKLYAFPFSMPTTGYISASTGGLAYRLTGVTYASSSSSGSTYGMIYLRMGLTIGDDSQPDVSTSRGGDQRQGFTIRCVAR